ncbi:MAG: TolC family outer membrane protein [Aquabacterium sp.]
MFKPAKANASTQAARPANRWRPLVQATAVAVFALMSASGSRAETLIDLYQAAKQYDAAYLSAKAQAETANYQLEQSYAAFRPSLGLKASLSRSRFDTSADFSPAEQQQVQLLTGSPKGNTSSTNRTISLNAKQALYNPADKAKIAQAEQNVVMTQSDLMLAENDLAARLTQAYFDVLAAQDVLNTTQTNKKAMAEQLASAKRNFEVGNATITDTREAQARYDLAAAQEIAATNDLQVKRIALDQLVGRNDIKPSPLATPINLDALAPGQMDEWVARTSSAPSVRKAEAGLQVAHLEVDKAKANERPTVSALASLSNAKNDSSSPAVTTRIQSGTTASVGVELEMALFAGGAIQNKIREALSQQEKAEHDVDNAKRTVALGTRQAFSAVQSGLAQVKAYEAAEASAKLALEATQLGYRVGVRINKDVLDAQTQVTTMQKDLYKARYDVIVGSIKLKQAAGSLTPDDLSELNKLLVQQ